MRALRASLSSSLRDESNRLRQKRGKRERFVSLLLDLDYDTSIQTRRDSGSYFVTTADPSRGVQIGAIGWFRWYAFPSHFFTVYTCDAFDLDPARDLNYPGLCSAWVNHLIQRAQRTQAIDPAAAAAIWAQVQ